MFLTTAPTLRHAERGAFRSSPQGAFARKGMSSSALRFPRLSQVRRLVDVYCSVLPKPSRLNCSFSSTSSSQQEPNVANGLPSYHRPPNIVRHPLPPLSDEIPIRVRAESPPKDLIRIFTGYNRTLDLQIFGSRFRFDTLFLRDSCRCSSCVDSSGQKTFQTSDIPRNINIRSARAEGESVFVEWKNDHPAFTYDHISTFHLDFFKNYIIGENGVEIQPWRDGVKMSRNVHWVDFSEFMHNEEALNDAVLQLHITGMIFVENIPDSEEAVEQIGERLGPLRQTFYGKTWDVRDKPDAENVAYTSRYLGLHMDLLYMREPPGLQLLHCLKSSCEGGESMFADTFAAAELLRKKVPDAFESLCEFPVTYSYCRDGHDYRFSRPTIVLSPYAKGKIDHVNWSPPFQGPLAVDIGLDDSGHRLRRHHHAIQTFAHLIQEPKVQLIHRLNPGQCVIFNNRRILHGRQAFQTGTGERWFKGAYVDTDAFESKVRSCKFGELDVQ